MPHKFWISLGILFMLGCHDTTTTAATPKLPTTQPSAQVLKLAQTAFECEHKKQPFADGTIAIIDYSLPSTKRRLWVIDTDSQQVLHQELIAHGRNTGQNQAMHFSNTVDSKQSSLGSFRTAETYHGKHGYSLRLDGLEPTFNGNARKRAIVIHGADYVSHDFAAQHGRLGRSWGCPALPKASSKTIINAIKGNRFLFVYADDQNWLKNSPSLHCPSD